MLWEFQFDNYKQQSCKQSLHSDITDITEHEKACEIATLFNGYHVSGYFVSISAYQFMCSKNLL